MDPIPDDAICAHCRRHKATIKFTKHGGMLEISHGFYELWCECCYTRASLEYAQNQAARIPELREKLKSACEGQELPDSGELINENSKLYEELRREWLWAHSYICGQHYPDRFYLYSEPKHEPGEHCYHPKPEILK